jgi:hypothetical protein
MEQRETLIEKISLSQLSLSADSITVVSDNQIHTLATALTENLNVNI